MDLSEFCTSANTSGHVVVFESVEQAESVAQHLRDITLDSNTIRFSDAVAMATAIDLAGVNRESYYFWGEKCRLPFKPLECDRTVPNIWVGCLSAYNQGHLHGMWIDATKDAEAIQKDIDYMLSWSPGDRAEEWSIMDYSNFEAINLGENPNLEKVSETANAIQEHGEAYFYYLGYFGAEYCSVDDFNERYVGHYKNKEEWASLVWEENGKLSGLENIGVNYWEIDWDAVGDTLSEDFILIDAAYEKLYVFWCVT